MYRRQILCAGAALTLMAAAGGASAQEARVEAQAPVAFDIAPQPLADGLNEFARQSGYPVMFTPQVAASKVTRGVGGQVAAGDALDLMLAGTGLSWRRSGDTFLVLQQGEGGSGPQAASAVEALIVTAQKKEENIQDVPIAISAFSQKALEEQKIEGGFDLLKAIPNVTFSKNNFTSYNFSIRGIGTKAVSATTDPGVAVAFNNTPLLQNRLFEQEYFDVERVEVLRGPQGTLYGRNATAGVINVISAKPDLNDFEGFIKGEVGNYDTKRLSAMVNVPIIEDVLAIRFAGALTDRQGYDYNALTKNAINGRDLWSGRITVGFEPTARIRGNLIWERFEEDDNRSRTGKQLCHRDPGLTSVNGTPVTPGASSFGNDLEAVLRPALFSQGCKPGSLYDDAAFGTPNGLALPFVFAPLALDISYVGKDPDTGASVPLLDLADPYANQIQSRDLRVIESIKDPVYRAQADIVELNIDIDLTDDILFSSQTAYNEDRTYSFQDFNRFNTRPVFNDTSNLLQTFGNAPSSYRKLAPGGFFDDPQLGKSDRLVGFDIAQGESRQFSQELRVQSAFDGPINFSLGANYTRFSTVIDYYVFYNLITAVALLPPFNSGIGNPDFDLSICGAGTQPLGSSPTPIDHPGAICPYIDPNPIESINGEGHNYFRSKNPYKVSSTAAFGEIYWQATDALKVTAGLRYTDDKKTFTPVPSQVLLSWGLFGGGPLDGNRGYPEEEPIKQHWGEWTGRLGVDWKPELTFTDDTMLYAFYSRGYKGGGANPPSPGFADRDDYIEAFGDPVIVDQNIATGFLPVLRLTAVEYGQTFEPEFVHAFEVGAKNTLFNGALTLNLGGFYYDYTDYQVSQIRDRTAVNENFDATSWGLELEAMFAPSRNLQIIANLGYLDTQIADGETSIDIMDRTAGNDDWVVVKPWLQLPSNCIVPAELARNWVVQTDALQGYWKLCGGVGGLLSVLSPWQPIDPATNLLYDPLYYDGTNGRVDINGGAGFAKELGGNELPNAPHWTANLGAQYGWDMLEDWRVTVRGDAYWQSQSWARVYNSDPYDKLHGWYNVNLSVWIERPDDGLKIELYAKNLLDKTPITDAFLNSDDSALTTNVFVLDPRLIGLSIRKTF